MLQLHRSTESISSPLQLDNKCKAFSQAKYAPPKAKSLITLIMLNLFIASVVLASFAHKQVVWAQNKVLPPIPIVPRVMPKISPKVREVVSRRDQAQRRSEALRKIQERKRVEREKKQKREEQARKARNKRKSVSDKPKAAQDDRAITAPQSNGDKSQVISESGKAPEDNLSEDFIKKCGYVKPKKNARFHLDIVDEELEAVVKLIACIKMRNIILSKPLKGKKITIYSPVKVSADEAYRAFLTALEANGLTISRQGKFWRIIEIKDFARSSDPFQKAESTPPREDRMVTQIVQLKHVDAQEVNEIITKLASNNAQIIIYQPNNSMIITELASNLRKLLALIKDLDVPGGEEQLWTYQILHAEATDIAQKIQEVFEVTEEKNNRPRASNNRNRKNNNRNRKRIKNSKSSKAESSSVGDSELDARVSKVIADERTNRLLIKANARSYARVKSLIAKLDIPVEGDGQVHIHQLNHAKAADLANVLSSLSQEQRSRGGNSGTSRRKPQAKRGKKSSATTGANSAALFEGEVSVTADEDTNALVITASFKDYLALKKVIDILDKPRRQVFIEAVVMEVSIRNQRDFGISLHGASEGTVAGETVPLVFSNQPGSTKSFDLSSAATLTGLAVATQGPASGVEIAGLDLPSFGAIMQALSKSDDVNIMSTPHILTTDNEEAEIVVGSNVPFIAGIAGGLGGMGGLGGLGGAAGRMGGMGMGGLGGFFPTVNVQRQDVALTLKITPRINAANFVTLEIDQVIEEIESIDPQVGPTTSKRSIKSTVVVQDQNTVVVGGLQKTRQINNVSAIPWLGEIPVIGYFFRTTKRDRERRNLLLLLTPHVIEGPDDFRAIFQRKLEEHREFVARFQQEGSELKLGLDFGKKHGLLEAINQSIRAAEKETELLEQLKKQEERPPLPQELDGVEVPSLNPLVPKDKTQLKPSSSSEVKQSDSKVKVQVSTTEEVDEKQSTKASSDELSNPFTQE